MAELTAIDFSTPSSSTVNVDCSLQANSSLGGWDQQFVFSGGTAGSTTGDTFTISFTGAPIPGSTPFKGTLSDQVSANHSYRVYMDIQWGDPTALPPFPAGVIQDYSILVTARLDYGGTIGELDGWLGAPLVNLIGRSSVGGSPSRLTGLTNFPDFGPLENLNPFNGLHLSEVMVVPPNVIVKSVAVKLIVVMAAIAGGQPTSAKLKVGHIAFRDLGPNS